MPILWATPDEAWPVAQADAKAILFRDAPYPVLILDSDGLVLAINREGVKTLALEEDRIMGTPILGAVAPDDRDRVRRIFLDVLRGRKETWTTRFQRGDGATRVKRVLAVPDLSEEGAEYIVLFFSDVTESPAGRPETLQLQTLLENLPDQLVAVLDTSGRIRYSSGFSRMHYRDDVDTIGVEYGDLLGPDEENQTLLREMLDETSAGKDWGGTHWHRRVDGSVFPVRTFASPYRDPRAGTVLGALVAGRDVSAEAGWRRRAQRAESLLPLGDLLGQIIERLEETLKDQGGGNFGRRASDRLITLLRELVFSREEDRTTVELPALAEAVAQRFRERSNTISGEILIGVSEEVATVFADPDRVERALGALVENSLDALEEHGGGRVEVRFANENEGVVVSVVDTAGCLSKEVASRALEPFYTTKAGRSGLGLPLADALVRGQGGRLWLDDSGDRRTTVCMVLPYDRPNTRVRFRPAPLSLTRARSVLLVDDDEIVRRGVRRFLEKVGFDVREAWSGRSAHAQITVGSPPELVVTDLKMSDGSGHWFMTELARDFPHLLRKTVIVSGAIDDVERQRLMRETGCPVMRKPVQLPELLDVLDEVAARS